MDRTYDSLVTLLPAQIQALYGISKLSPGTLGVGQDGSVISIDTGRDRFKLDAQGRIIDYKPKD